MLENPKNGESWQVRRPVVGGRDRNADVARLCMAAEHGVNSMEGDPRLRSCREATGDGPLWPRPNRDGTVRALLALSVGIGSVIGCDGESPPRAKHDLPPPPDRTAAEAQDLRVMLAELAGARACERVRGTFKGLDESSGSTSIGTLWIENCRASQEGTQLTVELSGRGWRWVDREKEKVGANFEVSDQARFSLDLRATGRMDVAYARTEHILSVWFTPQQAPTVHLEPIGDLQVDREGLWADVVGSAASLFAESPEELAEAKFSDKARQKVGDMVARGLTFTLDLCSGRVASKFGQVQQGQMATAQGRGPQDARRARVHRGGLIMTGPFDAVALPAQVTVDRETDAVRVQLVCADEAAQLADAFLARASLPAVATLDDKVVRGRAELSAPGASCPVVLTARLPEGASGTSVTFEYKLEHAERTSDPLLDCPAHPTKND